MDATRDIHIKWIKPILERQLLYFFFFYSTAKLCVYVIKLKMKPSRETKELKRGGGEKEGIREHS